MMCVLFFCFVGVVLGCGIAALCCSDLLLCSFVLCCGLLVAFPFSLCVLFPFLLRCGCWSCFVCLCWCTCCGVTCYLVLWWCGVLLLLCVVSYCLV